mgnify:CR=1 FL=1|jgi:hypothetical protein
MVFLILYQIKVQVVGEIYLEFIIDAFMHVWLIGCQGIHFYDTDGEINYSIDKEGLTIPHSTFKKHFYCPGAYCKFEGNINYFEDGDEAAEAYVNSLLEINLLHRKKKRLIRQPSLRFNSRYERE